MGSRRLLPRSAVRGLDGAEQGEDEGDAGGESAPDDVDWEAIDPALADAWAGQADDGLALAERLPLYVVVEKILEPGRRCRMIGRCTALLAMSLRVTTGLFVDPAHQRAFDDLYTRITGEGRRRPSPPRPLKPRG